MLELALWHLSGVGVVFGAVVWVIAELRRLENNESIGEHNE